ncbi:MAG: ATP-dependent Clp protease ATP-binding subunit, partial [Gemmatimonadetes bacterium]|nr:ATP-dependent Clp protease ATP-binding subunit [Gemmatimonadota bacterium]
MTTPDAPDLPLTPGAIRVLQELGPRPGVGVNDWLLLFLDRFGPMVGALAPGLDLAGTKASLRQSVTGGNNGAALDADRLTQEARAIARGLGKAQVAERDLVAAALRAAGHVVTYQLGVASPPRKPDTEPAGKAPGDPSPPAAPLAGIRTLSPTPTLERFGRDLTQAARDGVLPSCVGRDTEIETIIETLCRRTKRNPLLVGAAGTGKTAIVEGIARRIAQDQVPAPLRGVRLFGLQPSALVAGAGIVGELDKRVGAILAEAKQDGIVLFIDEVHAIMGAGGREGTGDISSMLKPALARGEIACIAATTDEEYRQFIEHDRALERRFQPIRIQELSPERTLEVLKVVRDDLVRGRGLEVG